MPLIYTRHDPRHYDRRLHKGGDGGAGEMRAQEEDRQRKVQSAVDAINGRFGIAPVDPSAMIGAAPTRDAFMRSKGNGYWQTVENGDAQSSVWVPVADDFDEAGYNAAMGDYSSRLAGVQTGVGNAKTAREAQYTDIAGAVRDTALRDLDRQYGKASLKNKFGLARSGLLGGQVDAEAGGELATLYGEGKLKAQQAGMGAASELRSADEQTRQRLISLAQSGLDTGTAGSLAASQMSAAADVARAQAGGATVGRLFDDLSQAYVANEVAKARGRPVQDPNGASYGGFGGSRYTGTIQR